jgi:hypothetical protein
MKSVDWPLSQLLDYIRIIVLRISRYHGMMSRFGTGGMMGGGFGMMIPFQPFMWWTAMTVIPVISIGTGVTLIIGGYLIYRKPESADKWGIAILVASIVSLFGMGGFFIGTIVGIIGGILALTRR